MACDKLKIQYIKKKLPSSTPESLIFLDTMIFLYDYSIRIILPVITSSP